MKPTIYKIVKRSKKEIIVNGSKTDVKITNWYIAKRKGNILGFWHNIGHEMMWLSDEVRPHTTATVEQMEEYLASYNEVYNNDKLYKIIYPPKE
jgi:hypothetical protein